MSAPSSSYVLGHSDHERRRLALQAAIMNPLTEEFLVRAGLRAGANVLDVGCGTGEVSLMAAKLVTPTGRVTGIDLDGGALDLARARAAESRLTSITFEEANLADYRAPQPYDALVGRLILIHTPDPLAALRHAAAQVRPGGIVAFQEFDLSRYVPCTPAKPLYEKTFQMLIDLFTRVTRADIGARLFEMFHQAGLTDVQSRGEFLVDGGANCPYYEWLTETVRSLLPKLEATGIATAIELDVDTLAERLKQEAVTIGGSLAGPVTVGTFGRIPY